MGGTRSPALTPTVGVIHRVHDRTPNVGLAAFPAAASRFANLDVLVIGIAHGADGGIALGMNAAQFP